MLKVRCLVKRFVRNLKATVGRGKCLEEELNEAKLDWCKYEQSFNVKEKHFENQKLALNLFCDEKELYRSKARLNLCGLENTLNRAGCDYWVTKGRQTVKKILSKYVIFKVIQRKTLLPPGQQNYQIIEFILSFHSKT